MSLTPVKVFNVLQGIACIAMALLADCDALDPLVPVLFALGCSLVLSGLCQLYFEVEVAALSTAVGLLVNLVYAGVIVCVVWLAALTWPESDRLWDGGDNCDGWVFGFVFVYTIVAAVEVGCMILFLRPARHAAANPESIV